MTKEEIISKIIFEAERKIKQNTGLVASLFCKGREFNSDSQLSQIILKLCADEYGIIVDQLIATSRVQVQCEARQVSMKFIRDNTTLTLKQIGELYMTKAKQGKVTYGKDHTTIIHGIKTIENLLEYNKIVIAKCNKIQADFDKIINC
jgi:chromosomal replication initiation ATPase DnaA